MNRARFDGVEVERSQGRFVTDEADRGVDIAEGADALIEIFLVSSVTPIQTF